LRVTSLAWVPNSVRAHSNRSWSADGIAMKGTRMICVESASDDLLGNRPAIYPMNSCASILVIGAREIMS
jgi:hypothetical protein